jgi:TonB family protein
VTRPMTPFAAFCLGLLLGGSFAVPGRIFGQDAPAETAKRKVRTKVVPDYPALAKQMNVRGKVKIEATVSPEGRVISTKVVGGSPVLVPAAADAAKKWRFEPESKETTELIEFDFN